MFIAPITHWTGEHRIRARRSPGRLRISAAIDPHFEAYIKHRSLPDSEKTLPSYGLAELSKWLPVDKPFPVSS